MRFQSQKQLIKQKSTRKERLLEYIKDKSVGKKTPTAPSQAVDSNNNTSVTQNNGGIKKPLDQASSSRVVEDKGGSENKALVYYVFDEDDEIQ